VDREIDDVPVYPNNYEKSRVRAFLNGLSYQVKETGGSEQTSNAEFLSKGFLYTAFTNIAQGKISSTTVDNSATSTNAVGKTWGDGTNTYACSNTEDDKIFLLSEQEATTTGYGFGAYNAPDSTRKLMTTDFAKANGAYQYNASGNIGRWWLRSPYYSNASDVRYVQYSGESFMDESVSTSSTGVVPALYVNLN
ncbi:MAG: hypothetical protein II563_00545, partial [Treponema sp.]|nr:hypothetical protein [Treponema sp.]